MQDKPPTMLVGGPDGTSAPDTLTAKEFFENVPPGQESLVRDLLGEENMGRRALTLPTLNLHCTGPDCNGIRNFISRPEQTIGKYVNEYITFTCRNCSSRSKTFAVRIRPQAAGALVLKYGEQPQFGPPTPSRVLTLLGDEKEYFLLGRRCESQGMGIGAFGYYRRVIEAKKTALIDEVLTVARALRASTDMIGDLERARTETQFTRAIDAIKHGIPDSLRIDGHNPLTLLHDALSEGLHAQSDEECLQFATAIRRLLFEFVERLAAAITDNREMKESLAKLLEAKRQRAERGK